MNNTQYIQIKAVTHIIPTATEGKLSDQQTWFNDFLIFWWNRLRGDSMLLYGKVLEILGIGICHVFKNSKRYLKSIMVWLASFNLWVINIRSISIKSQIFLDFRLT